MSRVLFLTAAFLAATSLLPRVTPKRPKIYNIAFVRLKSTDLRAATAFYSKTLGLRTGSDSCKNQSNPCFSVNPYQHVEITPTSNQQSGTFLETIAFTTSDIPQMHDYLAAHGARPTAISRGPNGLRSFQVSDPEANRIAFVESSGNDAQVNGLNQVSDRLFHAGFVVNDLAAENKFYVDLLGFRLYWQGGFKDDGLDWYELQVPDGDNWIEYMLNIPASANHKQLGVQNHFSLAAKDIHVAAGQLHKNGLLKFDGPEIGRDGKWGLDAYDPDGTRVEVMEFTPAGTPCCHPYTAAHPKP